jgi:hypothetical protein
MKRTPSTVHLAAAACLAMLASCTRGRSDAGEAEKVAREITPAVSARAGVPVAITCPEIRAGQPTQCQARTPTGETFPVEVTQDSAGRFTAEPRGVAFGKAVTDQITTLYAAAHDIALPGLSCPPIVLAALEEPVQCRARVQGVEVVFDVTVGDDGAAVFQASRGFVVSSLAVDLARKALARLQVEADIDCGPALRLSVPGTTFTCTASDATGATRPLYFRVAGDDGRIELRDRPFE